MRNVTATAQSIGDDRMNRESSIFFTITEMIVFFLDEFNKPPSSPESVSLLDMSSAGSGTSDRSTVSGRRSTMRVPRTKKPKLTVMGMNKLVFIRYQESGTATTVAIR
jgi:hypothetical protein